jgi:hypothetical protein
MITLYGRFVLPRTAQAIRARAQQLPIAPAPLIGVRVVPPLLCKNKTARIIIPWS